MSPIIKTNIEIPVMFYSGSSADNIERPVVITLPTQNDIFINHVRPRPKVGKAKVRWLGRMGEAR